MQEHHKFWRVAGLEQGIENVPFSSFAKMVQNGKMYNGKHAAPAPHKIFT